MNPYNIVWKKPWSNIRHAYKRRRRLNSIQRQEYYPLHAATRVYDPVKRQKILYTITQCCGTTHATRYIAKHKIKFMGQRGPVMMNRTPTPLLWTNNWISSPKFLNYNYLSKKLIGHWQAYLANNYIYKDIRTTLQPLKCTRSIIIPLQIKNNTPHLITHMMTTQKQILLVLNVLKIHNSELAVDLDDLDTLAREAIILNQHKFKPAPFWD